MSTAQQTRCTCTAYCGDCPGIRSGKTAACPSFVAAQNDACMRDAAPELLEALRVLHGAYRRAVGLIDPNHDDAYTVAVHNAIAKATGSAT